ncbi:MAG: DinB family protein [Phycisphaerales bacterium]
MNPLKIYDYLTQSRERVFNAARPLTADQWCYKFKFGLGTIGSTLTHNMTSEWYYFERFAGKSVPAYAQWEFQYEKPPAFETVEARWRQQQIRVREQIASERDWNRRIEYDTFADDAGKRYHITATSGDIFTQLTLHEVHHRAQIMAMLRELGGDVKPLQDIDYNDLMYERREIV